MNNMYYNFFVVCVEMDWRSVFVNSFARLLSVTLITLSSSETYPNVLIAPYHTIVLSIMVVHKDRLGITFT